MNFDDVVKMLERLKIKYFVLEHTYVGTKSIRIMIDNCYDYNIVFNIDTNKYICSGDIYVSRW